MKTHWLVKKNNPRCLIFMAGWGMGPEPFAEIKVSGADLLLCYDYRKLDAVPDAEMFGGYQRLDIIAWSMGVWMAARCFGGNDFPFASATAIGGTIHPLDDRKGIAVGFFTDMAEKLDKQKISSFYNSMFSESPLREKFMKNRPCRSIASLKDELLSIIDMVQAENNQGVEDIYDLKIITLRDRVFSARNQLRAWGREKSVRMEWSHFPFYRHDCLLDRLPAGDNDLLSDK